MWYILPSADVEDKAAADEEGAVAKDAKCHTSAWRNLSFSSESLQDRCPCSIQFSQTPWYTPIPSPSHTNHDHSSIPPDVVPSYPLFHYPQNAPPILRMHHYQIAIHKGIHRQILTCTGLPDEEYTTSWDPIILLMTMGTLYGSYPTSMACTTWWSAVPPHSLIPCQKSSLH